MRLPGIVGAAFLTGLLFQPLGLAAQETTTSQPNWVDEDRFIRLRAVTLETIETFDSENIPFWRCPKLAEHRSLAFEKSTYGRRAKGDIYAWLLAAHVLTTKDCSCTGKSVAWGEVLALYDALEANVGLGQLQPQHSAQYYDDGQRLTAIVEQACGGRF